MGYGPFKSLTKEAASDKILRDKEFIFLKIQITIDIKLVLLQWFINVLIKRRLAVVLKIKLILIKNYPKNYTNQLLENSRKETLTFYRQYFRC